MSKRRVLLDECLPHDLRHLITSADVETAQYAGLAGLKNGELLSAIVGKFDVFVTIDSNLRLQQNLQNRSFAVVILRAQSNHLRDLTPLAARLDAAVARAVPGAVEYVRD